MNQKFTSNNFLKRIRISKKKVSFGKFLEKQCSLALKAKKTKFIGVNLGWDDGDILFLCSYTTFDMENLYRTWSRFNDKTLIYHDSCYKCVFL